MLWLSKVNMNIEKISFLHIITFAIFFDYDIKIFTLISYFNILIILKI